MTPPATGAELLPPPIERRPASDTGAPGPLWTEWLLTNGLGGFAMGSVLGTPTRRYHGLLIAAARPPVERVVALSAVHETIVLDPGGMGERRVYLTPFHFADAGKRAIWSPDVVGFERGSGCVWSYRIDAGGGQTLRVRKRVQLIHGRQAVVVRYEVEGAACRIALRPLVALRGFHDLIETGTFDKRFELGEHERGMDGGAGGLRLSLSCEGARLDPTQERWRGFEYAWEIRRGLEAVEDLLVPGLVRAACDGRSATRVELQASVDGGGPASIEEDREARKSRSRRLVAGSLAGAGIEGDDARARPIARLTVAGDEFVVRRNGGVSVIAGYPWFADWGRDAMICLPGLFLAPGRLDEALGTLRTFAKARRNGLIPNRFDDHDAPAHYNTVDASLWFVHAAREYLDAGGDREAFVRELRPACVEIVEAYLSGTGFKIGVDPADGLVFAGDETTQLTWMDAQRAGVTFTPRHGKACEINALWHNALRTLAPTLAGDEPDLAARYAAMAERVAASYRRAFLGGPGGGLIDHLAPTGGGGWTPRGGIRPNQLFAVSLPHSPLTPEERRRVVDVVGRELVTPLGVRTLSRAGDEHGAASYRGRYEGTLFERDAAYHNGTAWAWLLPVYAEAVARAGEFSAKACAEARGVLAPLVAWLERGWAPGQLPEIFDGDDEAGRPQRPDGCPAQAWSVAETLRVWTMASRGA
ncbi:MAG: amylo-alpha-1,6-glucosidase [Phycisphaerales bacterium]